MNETEIPTPRTDAFKIQQNRLNQSISPDNWPWQAFDSILNFTRQLERENATMREVIKAAYDALEEAATKLAGWHGLYESQIGSDDYAAVLNVESTLTKLKPYLP